MVNRPTLPRNLMSAPSGAAAAAATAGGDTGPDSAKTQSPDPRAARLKAALKANLGRRKAQDRARHGGDPTPEGGAQND